MKLFSFFLLLPAFLFSFPSFLCHTCVEVVIQSLQCMSWQVVSSHSDSSLPVFVAFPQIPCVFVLPCGCAWPVAWLLDLAFFLITCFTNKHLRMNISTWIKDWDFTLFASCMSCIWVPLLHICSEFFNSALPTGMDYSMSKLIWRIAVRAVNVWAETLFGSKRESHCPHQWKDRSPSQLRYQLECMPSLDLLINYLPNGEDISW